MKRLGTITEARDKLGYADGAAVWDAVVRGELVVRKGEDPEHPDRWTVYLPEGRAS